MVPCPGWLHNEDDHTHADEAARYAVATKDRHWCYVLDEDLRAHSMDDAEGNEFLLSSIKLRDDIGNPDTNHVKEIDEHTLKDLGHKWNWEWINQWFDEKEAIEQKVKNWHWDEFNAKVAGVEDGSVAYWKTS